jgi:formate hydrogenlyase transcriptional activator
LENVIERALVLSQGGVLHIGPDLVPTVPTAGPLLPDAAAIPAPSLARGTPAGTLEDVLRAHIASTLELTGWVIEGPRGAARILNLHPNTLRSRLKKLGLAAAPGGKSR